MDSIEYSRVAGAFRKPNRRSHEIVLHLRGNETDAEGRLWKKIRGNKILGAHFRRQHKIGKFIVDFFCFECRLAIEVDGKIHLQRVKEDETRTHWLESQGIRVIRFSNEVVFAHLKDVQVEIEKVVSEQLILLEKKSQQPIQLTFPPL